LYCLFLFDVFFVRYSVKLVVFDETGEAIFVVFDADMNFLLDRHCASNVALAKIFLICVDICIYEYINLIS
jgi:hypothetical protein